uniref:Uncharacterized protein n=1 Tax=Steinernema glaseri TaxID=37863 RepID=A0A1I7YZX4_9BILA
MRQDARKKCKPKPNRNWNTVQHVEPPFPSPAYPCISSQSHRHDSVTRAWEARARAVGSTAAAKPYSRSLGVAGGAVFEEEQWEQNEKG